MAPRNPIQPSNASHTAGDYVERVQLVDAAGNLGNLGSVTLSSGESAADPVFVSQAQTTSATVTQVASSASSVTLIASNASARARKVYNDSTQVVYVKFGTTASTTSYTVQIPSQGYYEFPTPLFTGRVDAIWASANGNAYVTEEIA